LSKARDRGFKEATRIEEARRIFYEALPATRLPSEQVAVPKALNRILAEDVRAEISVPSFAKSAMDGYAVAAEDTFGSAPTNPSLLKLVGESKIGESPKTIVEKGQTVAIATGAPVPQGANAVVMVENTKRLETGDVEIYAPVAPGENVSQVGEDVKQGTVVLEKGRKLKPPDLGLLVALGRGTVNVVQKPKVGVLSTGNELLDVSPGETAKIADVNRPVLMAMVEESGGMPLDLGIARDDTEQISRKLKQGLASTDLVLVTAGTSVGKGDLVPDVIDELGKPGMLVHGIAMRPSLPTGLAVVDGKPVISLPGLPVSAMLAFSTFAQPLILRMLETEPDPQPKVKARTTKRIVGVPGFRTFIRVQVRESDGKLIVEPLRAPGSSILTTLTRANGIVVVPENVEGFDEGAEIEVQLFRPVERGENAGRS
jgi:molybdenum cofactor synthesis domain-containing protein